jgi:peroxidase
VPTGRRDGLSSLAAMAEQNLPSPSFTTPALTQAFLSHGLTQDEMITLSGT